MTRFALLLRAVNVGGSGKLPMADLRALCCDAGLENVQTWITSGNVVCTSPLPEAEIKSAVESRLMGCAGKPVAVLVRDLDELRETLAANPFAKADPKRLGVLFLDAAPVAADLVAKGQQREEFAAHGRAVFVHYPDGMGASRLRLPAMAHGTTRNLNTLARLVAMLDAMPG